MWVASVCASAARYPETSAATAFRRYREALDVLRPLLEDCR